MNDVIKLSNEWKKYPYHIEICLGHNQDNNVVAEITMEYEEEYRQRQHEFNCELRNRDQWDNLGKIIGRSRSIRKLSLYHGVSSLWADEEPIHTNGISDEEYRCLQLFYRGLETNHSIEELELDMDLFPDGEILPTFNLVDAQFRESLKKLMFYSENYITNNQSLMISSVLDSISLECLHISLAGRIELTDESSFRRIVMACTNVKTLKVKCHTSLTTPHFVAIADLLRDHGSILRELVVGFHVYGESRISIIAAGLTGNTILRKLHMRYSSGDVSLIEKLLCDTTSIGHIYNSNHTLEILENGTRSEIQTLEILENGTLSEVEGVPVPVIRDLLEINTNTNKEEVIRTKIARYYFVGNFDLSPFVNMNVSLLPSVLAMIKGGTKVRCSAIFRLVRSIPDLCNVTGREVIAQFSTKDTDKSFNKRQKTD